MSYYIFRLGEWYRIINTETKDVSRWGKSLKECMHSLGHKRDHYNTLLNSLISAPAAVVVTIAEELPTKENYPELYI